MTMLTNLYTTPLTAVKLPSGYTELMNVNCTPKASHYVSLWVECSGGTATIRIGDTTVTVSSSQRIVTEYYPNGNHMFISMTVVSGSPTVSIVDITVCKDYASTKKTLDSLNLTRFTGDTMPLA